MDAVAGYYEAQSVRIAGRETRQTLLMHANALNAAAFDALGARYAARGYRFIPLERALDDEAYAMNDDYFGPAGMAWLHRWALTRKMPLRRSPASPPCQTGSTPQRRAADRTQRSRVPARSLR